MGVIVVVLVLTNLLAVGVVVWLLRRPPTALAEPDAVTDALNRTPSPASSPSGTRRLITIEILNPIELAATRGRLVGLVGSLAPGLTRRAVYDQTMKTLKQQLVAQQVVADVRLHTVRAPGARPGPAVAAPAPVTPPPATPDPWVVEHEPVPRQGRQRPPPHPPGTPCVTSTRRAGGPGRPDA